MPSFCVGFLRITVDWDTSQADDFRTRGVPWTIKRTSLERGRVTRSDRGLAVRHDHGSQYMSHHFQTEIAFLGIESSPAFVRAPEGNGCAERFIRTLKENLLWVRSFDTIEELRQALLEFRQTYNATWLIERHGFLTPAQFRQKQLQTAAIAA